MYPRYIQTVKLQAAAPSVAGPDRFYTDRIQLFTSIPLRIRILTSYWNIMELASYFRIVRVLLCKEFQGVIYKFQIFQLRGRIRIRFNDGSLRNADCSKLMFTQ